MLLPGEDADMGEIIDPREELVRQIIEYRRVKQAGQLLKDLQEEAALRWPRGRSPLPEVPAGEGEEPPGVREATLYDVFATFHRLLRETEAGEPRRIVYDEVPMEVHAERILSALGGGGGAAGLLALIGRRRDRNHVLGTFLAILELMKEGRILAVQREAGADIEIVLQDSDPGRAALGILRERARRQEAETPGGKPRRRPPWKKDGAPGPDGAPPAEGVDPGEGPEPPPAPEAGGPGSPSQPGGGPA
jgi:chromatin segregation and condensation protein Rec8/ScpA/Scc1 (kleisin family)